MTALMFLRKICFIRSNFTLFIPFLQWWLKKSSNEYKTTLQNEYTKLNQLASQKHAGLRWENVRQKNLTEWLDMYLMRYKRGTNEVNTS